MGIADQMTSAAVTLLSTLDDQQRQLAQYAFDNVKARRWLEYRPEQRPGACIAYVYAKAPRSADVWSRSSIRSMLLPKIW